MNKKNILLGLITISLLVLSFSTFTLMVHGAANYSLNVVEGDSKTYNVVVNDNNDVGGQAGGTTTVTILKITQHSTDGGWTLNIDPGNNDPGSTMLNRDPDIKPTYPGFVCALDVGDYLAAVKDGWNSIDPNMVSVTGNTLKVDVRNTAFDFISTNVWEVTYDSTTGWASELKFYTDDTLVTHIYARWVKRSMYPDSWLWTKKGTLSARGI